jgi:HlyD family secretion protein
MTKLTPVPSKPGPEQPFRPAPPRRGRERVRGRHRAISEFQSDAAEIEERPPPRLARLTLYCVLALIAAAIAWASFSQVDVIVTAPGKLMTTTANIVVQPLETSVIREMHVKVGDVVERGQRLATLDPTFSQADVDQLRNRVSALDAAIARLDAEMNGKDYVPTDAVNPDQSMQRRLFSERTGFFESSLKNYDAQIASAEANIKTATDEIGLLLQRRDTLNSIETIRRILADKELGSRLNLLASHDARLEVEHSLSRIRGSSADNTHRLEKVKAERQVFIDDFRRTAYQELVDTTAKRSSAAEDLRKAELRRNLIVLTAPVDAVVLEIGNRSVGSVAREAETLFSLVPRNVPLQAEVRVDGKDIGRIEIGQLVRIKFDAFPFQKYGTGTGTVRVISRDAFAPEAKGEAAAHAAPLYYRVLVDINDAHLRDLPENFVMIPGMTVTAELHAGNRSVISYFLYPLIRGLDESVREP